MSTKSRLAPLVAIFLAGCGTVVPDIQEFWGTREDATKKVMAISGQVVCELRRAVQTVLADDRERPVIVRPDPHAPPIQIQHLDWFEQGWGVQVTLNLNIVESSGVAPGVSFTRNWGTQSFTAGLGGSLSSTATRTDKLNMFFTVAELAQGYPSMNLPCVNKSPVPASLFIESDLKLYDWLHAALLPNLSNLIPYQSSKAATNVIQHEVKFQIVSSGSATPAWKLVAFTANTAGTFLSASRDRTQDLTITFGPLADGASVPVAAKNANKRAKNAQRLQLATPAENAHLASQIGLAVSQSLK